MQQQYLSGDYIKHMKYGSKTETTSQILETANGLNARRTEKMYNAFSNYSQLTEYLGVLTQGDLRRYNGLTQISITAEMDLRFPITYKWLNLWLKDSQGVGKNAD